MAVCVLRCQSGHRHGVVLMKKIRHGVEFKVFIEGLPEGYHGFHIHRKGNELEGCQSLCDHYNPTKKHHGDRNSLNSHVGDLGNLYSDASYIVDEKFIAKRVRLPEIFGRSLIVHADRDDLGKGDHSDSLTTGHSGERILWGVIGIDDNLPCER